MKTAAKLLVPAALFAIVAGLAIQNTLALQADRTTPESVRGELDAMRGELDAMRGELDAVREELASFGEGELGIGRASVTAFATIRDALDEHVRAILELGARVDALERRRR